MPIYNPNTMIYEANVTLNHTQILALNSTPIAIVSGYGAGTAIYSVGAVAYLNYGGTAYATNTNVSIVPTSHTTQTQLSFASILAQTASLMEGAIPIATTNMNQNEGMSVRVVAGAPANGHANSTITIRYYYKVVPYPLP